MSLITITDTEKRKLLKKWESSHKAFQEGVQTKMDETPEQKVKRMKRLEADPEEWFKEYFPKYAKNKPAKFHRLASRRIIDNPRWYEVRAWSRGFAKSTRTMMETLYLALTGQIRNIVLVSASYEAAELLITPYRVNLESNPRIIADYGEQRKLGAWESGRFTTNKGVSFVAIGAGQSPRGTRNEEVRPDLLLIDDIDTDEETRNQKRIREKWEWIEQALIPTVDISSNYRIVFCGNIIAKDCCITRAIQKANKADIVNLIDEEGKSNWPEKVSQKDIDDIRRIISYLSFQKEYMNNPLTVGTIFTEMHYGKILPLAQYEVLICYTDPSFKDSKKNDYKATVLIGKYRNQFHVIKAFVEQTTTARMVEWHYEIMQLIGENNCYYYMESNMLQDTILQEFMMQSEKVGKVVPILGDARKKAEKFSRIESLCEPLNRNGQLILNEEEKASPGMKTLDEQFTALEPGSKAHDDGPDAVEGGIWIANNKQRQQNPGKVGEPGRNSKRY